MKTMFKAVILQIKFPCEEFDKLSISLNDNFLLRYICNKSALFLGNITSIKKETPKKIVAELEIRKDETPGWYLKEILKKAKQSEIVILKKEKVICKKGKIFKVIGLDQISSEDIVAEVKITIHPT